MQEAASTLQNARTSFRRTRSPDDRQVWIQHERERHRVYRIKEDGYWLSRVAEYSSQPRKLWKTFSSLMGFDNVSSNIPTGSPSAHSLIDYFVKKIEAFEVQPASRLQQSPFPKLQPFSIPSGHTVWTRCEM